MGGYAGQQGLKVCTKEGVRLIKDVAVALAAFGLIILVAGVFFRQYPKKGRFIELKPVFSLEVLANSRLFRPLVSLFVRRGNGRLCRITRRALEISETDMSINAVFLLKIISVILTAAVVISIRYTNIGVMTASMISRSQNYPALFQERSSFHASDSFKVYNSIMKSVGKGYLKKLNDEKKMETVLKVLPDILKTQDENVLQDTAASFINAFNAVSKLELIDWKSLMVIFGAFWLPEAVLWLRYLLIGGMYRREVIKLENIFELLGSINGFRTIDILSEMSEAPGVYQKHLRRSVELFKTERELALEDLKKSVGNSRFSRLIDVMRVYSLVDKNLAVQILERNRLEKEEEMFLTAEEDMDIIDIAAFISIIPILLELANLLMQPMLDLIYEAFMFI